MKVLIACEFSGIVRRAFAERGHYVVSVDLLPSEIPNEAHSYHVQMDIVEFLMDHNSDDFDLMIAHPPCIYLTSSGARWWKERKLEQKQAIYFFVRLTDTGINRFAIENPIGIMSTVYRKPDQIIQPWMFGHGETKATCLWLKKLPKLIPTNIVDGRLPRVHHESPGKDRWKNRSRTLKGIADAMASQWGALSDV